jgi:hypothetical protein
MAARTKTTKAKAKSAYDRATKALARDCSQLARLLWVKAIANSTPEVREMLIVHKYLRSIDRSIFPEDQDPPCLSYYFDRILEDIQRAEAILTDEKPGQWQDVTKKMKTDKG